jgi:hypothetical protein
MTKICDDPAVNIESDNLEVDLASKQPHHEFTLEKVLGEQSASPRTKAGQD